MSVPPMELPADVRQLTITHHALFLGYVQAGFTRQEALYLLGLTIQAAWANGEDE